MAISCPMRCTTRRSAESPLSPLAALLVDLRSVFAAFETKEPLAVASERFSERLIKLNKVAIWFATVGAAISGDETHRIGRQTPALAIERGQDRSNDAFIFGRANEGLENVGVFLCPEASAPKRRLVQPARQSTARSSPQD
jgi:hypothetical protein